MSYFESAEGDAARISARAALLELVKAIEVENG